MPWINSGIVPLSLASKYISAERSGIYTPDEKVQRQFSGKISVEHANTAIEIDETSSGISMNQLTIKGKRRANSSFVPFKFVNSHDNILINPVVVFDHESPQSYTGNFSQVHEEVLVMCFSTKFDKTLMSKLEKECCVKIIDLSKLKKSIDQQLGTKGICGRCKYTKSTQRNHFLKSFRDSWQSEFRIVWRIDPAKVEEYRQTGVHVSIPNGIARKLHF